MITYAGWYVLAGAAYYGLFYLFVGKKRSRPGTSLWANFVGGITGEKPLWDKLVGLLAPFVATALILAAWPLVLWTSVAERKKGTKGTDPWETERKFAVLDAHLVCELPLADIECWETVDDPLGGAPRVPFGHLNPAWEEFKADNENGAFWKFSGKYVSNWDVERLYEGYTVLKQDGTRPYFLTHVEYVGLADGNEGP